ncbi:MAG: DUF4361 domain-containing protein [Tannerella sp.]|nr:DUF4361 domain-containing protein [Tannerella sp.]
MKKYLIILLMVAGAILYSSCDRDELFEREQYKPVFALLSDDGFNIFAEEHDLELEESPGFISAVCGGTLPTEKDINITVAEDESLLLQYNLRNFDVEESKYARWLPRNSYDIENYSITIPAGERIGLMPLKIRANGLSPDTIYFIPLRVDRFSSYELNSTKSTVLYRVFMKNYYATNQSVTNYTFHGKSDGINVMGSKRVFPVRGNSVRTMAGNLNFESSVDVINKGAVLLTVDKENKVLIQPWKDLNVIQIDGDPDYPNTFSIYNDGYSTYKTFLLRYNYVYDGKTYQIQEELRLEFKEKNDY